MLFQADEALQIYIDESLDHLADFENDLLAIEKNKHDIDENLVNKVFRSAHSIKGGAGLLGYINIKELSHKIENILGMIRNNELMPSSDIINVLLKGTDILKELFNNITESNGMNIEECLNILTSISENKIDAEAPPESNDVSKTVSLSPAESSPPSDSIGSVDKDALQVYLDESHEHLENFEHDLLEIEKQGIDENKDLVNKIFRGAHSIKGGAGFLGFNNIKELAHKTENILGLIRTKKLSPTSEVVSILLKSSDLLKSMLTNIHDNNNVDISEQLNALDSCTAPSVIDSENKNKLSEHDEKEPEKDSLKEPVAPTPPDSLDEQDKPKIVKAAPIVQETVSSSSNLASSLRVRTNLLDLLMTLAGEMVLSRNQLLQATSSKDMRAIEVVGQRVNHITSELQEAIMQTRMQPVANVFNKFPRLVRDIAREVGKDVALIIEGKGVELDKTIIEAINDPLIHLIRNSIDHGIEFADERIKKGKPAQGKIILKASHEAGHVFLEVKDDGAGLDSSKFARKALNLGLIEEEQLRMMSKKDKFNLILLPGFSTAEEITDVSGRGVGMDVVKTNFDKLGGQIDINSILDEGTTIRIKLPLTLAIISSQIVINSGQRFAVPQVNILELLRIPADQVKHRIEKVGDAEVVRLRGNLLPLVKLSAVLGIDQYYIDPGSGLPQPNRRNNIADRRSKNTSLHKEIEIKIKESIHSEDRNLSDRRYRSSSALNIVIVNTGMLKYGLVVDELHDSEEIVVKPLGRHLNNCNIYAGATIMGDGLVALILDITNIARSAGLTSVDGSDRAHDVAKESEESAHSKNEKQALLIFKSAADEQFAVPLNQVLRIEKIKKSAIEIIGERRVMQYRGGTLPLFSIDEASQVKPLADCSDYLVLIFTLAGQEVGLLATPPVNAIEFVLNIDDKTNRQIGILGSCIIDNNITLFANVYDIYHKINPEWFANRPSLKTKDGHGLTILTAEDSNFFRSQIKQFLEDEGYNVIEAEDGMVALNILQERSSEISLVVTDIEMPNLDGFGLAKAIKNDNLLSHLPIVALTTLAGEKDVALGKQVGIDSYLVKLDKENLLETIHSHLSNTIYPN